MDRVQTPASAMPSSDDRDIRRAAQLLFQQYGSFAMPKARELAEAMRRKGDDAAAETWRRIADAIGARRSHLRDGGCDRRNGVVVVDEHDPPALREEEAGHPVAGVAP